MATIIAIPTLRRRPQTRHVAGGHEPIEEAIVDRQLIENLSDSFAARAPTTPTRSRRVTQDQAVHLQRGGDVLPEVVVLAGQEAEESLAQVEVSPLRASASRGRKCRSFGRPTLSLRRVAAGVQEGVFEVDLTALCVAKEAARGRAGDEWLALIGRKTGRIAGEPWPRVGAATEDGEGMARASLAMTEIIDADAAGRVVWFGVWASCRELGLEDVVGVGDEGDNDEGAAGRRRRIWQAGDLQERASRWSAS